MLGGGAGADADAADVAGEVGLLERALAKCFSTATVELLSFAVES